MRIDQNLAKGVVFVGIETERGFVPTGTGWLVAVRRGDHTFLFVLTASHIVEQVSPDLRDRFVARLNRKDGTTGYVKLPAARQYSHENAATDLTMFSVEIDRTAFDCLPWELERANIEKVRAENDGIMPGDHVCAIGLYTSHYGQISNKPVVRTGNVSAIADEPLYTKRGFAEAHLIELRTIAGLSGSPVFQTHLPVRIKNGTLQQNVDDVSHGIPLGILIGYHVLQSKEDQITAPPQGEEPLLSTSPESSDQLNTGFGLVIPIERVFEMLEKLDPEMAAVIARERAMATAVLAGKQN